MNRLRIARLRRGVRDGVLIAGSLGACSVEDGILGGLRGGHIGDSRAQAGNSGAQVSISGAKAGNSGAKAGDSGGNAGDSGGSADDSGGNAGDSGGNVGDSGGNAGFAGNAGTGTDPSSGCGPTSPAVTLPFTNAADVYPTCTGRIAAATFNNALCVCNTANVREGLITRGFDSSQGPYVAGRPDDSGAAVGINGDYKTIAGYTDVGGSLSIAGSNDVDFIGYLITRGDFRAAGDVTVAGYASIARNAWLAGTFVVGGALTVSGELHHAQSVIAPMKSVDREFQEPVTVSKPCPCEATSLLDVGHLVDQARRQNDNARHQIGVDALAAVSSATQLVLPCGSFYLTQIGGTGNVVIQVGGMTALFIDGSVSLNGNLRVELDAGAEIDIFVRGNLSATGSITLGTHTRPAAVRAFVGGAEDVNLTSPFVGNLYAPHARVVAASDLMVYGSIFAKDFVGSSRATFVFDRAVYLVDRGCAQAQPPPGACSQCGSCTGGTACVGGICGPCRDDNDCCSQTVCQAGSCVFPLIELR